MDKVALQQFSLPAMIRTKAYATWSVEPQLPVGIVVDLNLCT